MVFFFSLKKAQSVIRTLDGSLSPETFQWMVDVAVTVSRGCFRGVCPLQRKIWGELVVMQKCYSRLKSLRLGSVAGNRFPADPRKGHLESDNFAVSYYRSTWKPVKSLFPMVWAQILINEWSQLDVENVLVSFFNPSLWSRCMSECHLRPWKCPSL